MVFNMLFNIVLLLISFSTELMNAISKFYSGVYIVRERGTYNSSYNIHRYGSLKPCAYSVDVISSKDY